VAGVRRSHEAVRAAKRRQPVGRPQKAGSDALGDPSQSFAWTVNKIRSLGYELKPGMIVITGALGRVTDAAPGAYVAHYGQLGELKFKIEGNDDALQTPRQ